MNSVISTPPLADVIPAAPDNLHLAKEVRSLAKRFGWRDTARMLGLSLDATRMLGADASRCQRGTRDRARLAVAELASLSLGGTQ